MTATSTPARPAGRSPGTFALPGAWLVGVAIARLTGAAAVVLLLVATLIAFGAIALAGWVRSRSVQVHGIIAADLTTAGEQTTFVVDHTDCSTSRSPVWIDFDGVRDRLANPGPTTITRTLRDPGVVRTLDVSTVSAGAAGMVWWRRRHSVSVDPIHVAPRAAGPLLAVELDATRTTGEGAATSGHRTGEVDGVRPWRVGESEQAIHWPTTLRAGEVIAHERTPVSDVRWEVDLDSDPPRLRTTLEEGLRRGHHVVLRTRTDQTPGATRDEIVVRTNDEARRWSAIAAARVTGSTPVAHAPSLWRRRVTLGASLETATVVGVRTRLATAVAAAISIWMLLGALDSGPGTRLFAIVGIVATTAASLRFRTRRTPLLVRGLVVAVTLAALGRIAVQNAGISGLLEALRGPLPDLLLLLVILHGTEITDRRTNRVHLAITGIVTAYAAGLRLDGAVGGWMIAWGVAAIVAVVSTESDPATGTADDLARAGHARRSSRDRRGGFVRMSTWSVAGLVATLGVASLVPIPDGPASLGLPALSNDSATIGDAGSLVGPDGQPPALTSGPSTRGAIGQAGGYPGFSETLDTSVRGDLGDEIVMRVRAPEPAFWRGQTFADFDGRIWRVANDTTERLVDGPTIRLAPTLGDRPADGVATNEFVQTFDIEADLPNVVFAAGRPDTVIFDGAVTARSDGALRADRTLTDGTVYSVVSQRVDVTADTLRAQGDFAARFAPFAGDADLAPFLAVPDSTSPATRDLAEQLRVEGSTYDSILAYERWIAANTQYDLSAPIPDGDAVDDFLFGSQRGFCEQIASSLVVMLRSQGVPTRLATGYAAGERDRISGVFSVRASDAHAWVEVWFPDTGWEAFDPTATVPLAGDAGRSTVGADAVGALIDGVLARPVELGALIAAAFGILTLGRLLAELRRRRTRGPWGVLHDRFLALAPTARTAPRAATALVERIGPDAEIAHDIAVRLDRAAFDPRHRPDATERADLARSIAVLERTSRHPSRRG